MHLYMKTLKFQIEVSFFFCFFFFFFSQNYGDPSETGNIICMKSVELCKPLSRNSNRHHKLPFSFTQ